MHPRKAGLLLSLLVLLLCGSAHAQAPMALGLVTFAQPQRMQVTFQAVTATTARGSARQMMRLSPAVRRTLNKLGYRSVKITDEVRTPLRAGPQQEIKLRFARGPKKRLQVLIVGERPLRLLVESPRDRFRALTRHERGGAYVVVFKRGPEAQLLIVSPNTPK